MMVFSMVKVTTSIKIDNDKRELAKKRGIVLTDLLDQALDMALGLELKESNKLQNEKEELLQQKEILEKEKEDFLKDHESKILEIDFKIKSIDQALENAIIEDKEETKLKEYDLLVRRGAKFGGIDNDIDLIKDIDKFYDKYESDIGDYDQFIRKIEENLITLMFEGKYDLQL